MTATFTTRKQKFTTSHRKANGFKTAFLGLSNAGEAVVEARIYQPSHNYYCAVWIRTKGEWHTGTGSATGGGYHMASAALAEALINAGVDLSEAIDGWGEGAMLEAIRAVTVARHWMPE
jgi:hypothetical protein